MPEISPHPFREIPTDYQQEFKEGWKLWKKGVHPAQIFYFSRFPSRSFRTYTLFFQELIAEREEKWTIVSVKTKDAREAEMENAKKLFKSEINRKVLRPYLLMMSVLGGVVLLFYMLG